MWSTFFTRWTAVLGLTAAGLGSGFAQDKVKVGMVMPLTGTLASAGKQVAAGARLYLHQHGIRVAGKEIELVVKDDTSSFEVGKRLIQESIVNDRVDIVGGGLTGDLFASAALLTEEKKPTVIMLSSTSAVIDKSPYFVRTSCTLAQSSAIMADWAMKADLKRVVTVVSDFSPGHEADCYLQGSLSGGWRADRRVHPRATAEPGLRAVLATRARCRAASAVRVYTVGAGGDICEAIC
jgi:branched-chain amino acid transport system substrate-binding protein